jgi:hypothetical protein
MILLQVGLDTPALGLSEELEVVRGFAGQDVRQAVKKLMALVVGREALCDHGVVTGEALGVLLHADAVERPAVDDQDPRGLQHSA